MIKAVSIAPDWLAHVPGQQGGSVTELAGGSRPVFRLDLTNGTSLIVKTYDQPEVGKPAREAYATALLDGLGLPVTRYLMVDESRANAPFAFAIVTYLAGETAASLAGDPEISAVYRQMGALLRKLHTVRLPAYGVFDGSGIVDPLAANVDFVRRQAAKAFAQFRRYGADEPLVQQLEQIFATHLDLAGHSTGAVFAHDDLHHRNVLVTRDRCGHLEISGLIDFGNAHAADAVSDLAKTLFMAEHDAPEAIAHIRAGYGPIDHPDPEGALWFYMLLHRVVMWWWLRQVGVIADGEHSALLENLREMAEQGAPRLS